MADSVEGVAWNARVAMQVDDGIGVAVYPAVIWITDPVLLDHPVSHLLAYTPENAVAEKHQAVVVRDKASRYYVDFEIACLAVMFVSPDID